MLYFESIANHVIDCCNSDVRNLFATTETRRMIEEARRVQRSSRIVDNNGVGTTITSLSLREMARYNLDQV